MRVAVITPYYKTRPEWLEQCCASVNRQTHPCTHILIADGAPQPLPDDFSGQHIILAKNHGDYGDTPRALGSIAAVNQGFDAIAYLDADNWYEPDHIQSMVELQSAEKADVCTSSRNLFSLDGRLLGKDPESGSTEFVDTSCLFFNESAFSLVNIWWMMPRQFHCIGDRFIWHYLRTRGYKTAHLDACGVSYRSAFKGHYEFFGEAPPADAKAGNEIVQALQEFQQYVEKERRRRQAG